MIDMQIFQVDNMAPNMERKMQLVLMAFMTNLASHFERSTLERRITMPLRSIVQTVSPVFAIKTIPSCNIQVKGVQA